jgi:hypothetical protein
MYGEGMCQKTKIEGNPIFRKLPADYPTLPGPDRNPAPSLGGAVQGLMPLGRAVVEHDSGAKWQAGPKRF